MCQSLIIDLGAVEPQAFERLERFELSEALIGCVRERKTESLELA